jgi:hypothetical protein
VGELLPRASALALLDRIDRALPFTSVATAGSEATVWFADVTAHARAGGDPLAPWRAALRSQQSGAHGAPAPTHVAAAFVLQWWCEVAATPIAYAARLGGAVVVPDAAGLGFEVAAGLHPHRLVVDPDRLRLVSGEVVAQGVEEGAAPDVDVEPARTAYLGLVEDVVRGFAPEVTMGPRQRWGVVEDVWESAVRLADGAAGVATGPARRRVSCCFIYALPGMRECASCPRSGPPRGRV